MPRRRPRELDARSDRRAAWSGGSIRMIGEGLERQQRIEGLPVNRERRRESIRERDAFGEDPRDVDVVLGLRILNDFHFGRCEIEQRRRRPRSACERSCAEEEPPARASGRNGSFEKKSKSSDALAEPQGDRGPRGAGRCPLLSRASDGRGNVRRSQIRSGAVPRGGVPRGARRSSARRLRTASSAIVTSVSHAAESWVLCSHITALGGGSIRMDGSDG
jgi:hypothetical protein